MKIVNKIPFYKLILLSIALNTAYSAKKTNRKRCIYTQIIIFINLPITHSLCGHPWEPMTESYKSKHIFSWERERRNYISFIYFPYIHIYIYISFKITSVLVPSFQVWIKSPRSNIKIRLFLLSFLEFKDSVDYEDTPFNTEVSFTIIAVTMFSVKSRLWVVFEYQKAK